MLGAAKQASCLQPPLLDKLKSVVERTSKSLVGGLMGPFSSFLVTSKGAEARLRALSLLQMKAAYCCSRGGNLFSFLIAFTVTYAFITLVRGDPVDRTFSMRSLR